MIVVIICIECMCNMLSAEYWRVTGRPPGRSSPDLTVLTCVPKKKHMEKMYQPCCLLTQKLSRLLWVLLILSEEVGFVMSCGLCWCEVTCHALDGVGRLWACQAS